MGSLDGVTKKGFVMGSLPTFLAADEEMKEADSSSRETWIDSEETTLTRKDEFFHFRVRELLRVGTVLGLEGFAMGETKVREYDIIDD